jgi:hypothetical protein
MAIGSSANSRDGAEHIGGVTRGLKGSCKSVAFGQQRPLDCELAFERIARKSLLGVQITKECARQLTHLGGRFVQREMPDIKDCVSERRRSRAEGPLWVGNRPSLNRSSTLLGHARQHRSAHQMMLLLMHQCMRRRPDADHYQYR